MQIAKVTIENVLSGWREIASLNDVATPILPDGYGGRDATRRGGREAAMRPLPAGHGRAS
jgi:hypothetical protein